MRLFFLCLLFPCSIVFSQVDFAVHAGGGASLIYNSATVNMNHLYFGSPIRSIPKRSFEVGVTARKYYERTYLETGLSYSFIQSLHKEHSYKEIAPPGFGFLEIHVEKLRKIGYIAMPVIWCRNYGSFSIGAGIQPQFTVHVSEEKKLWIAYPDTPVDPLHNRRTIKKFDLGFVGQANLEATPRISLNFKLYWGITNINNYQEKGVMYEFYQEESPVVDRRLKNRQFVISLQYKLFTNKVSEPKNAY